MAQLREEIIRLRERGDSVTIDGRVFGSFGEVLDWTKRFLPSGRYGNIVDALSLMEI